VEVPKNDCQNDVGRRCNRGLLGFTERTGNQNMGCLSSNRIHIGKKSTRSTWEIPRKGGGGLGENFVRRKGGEEDHMNTRRETGHVLGWLQHVTVM